MYRIKAGLVVVLAGLWLFCESPASAQTPVSCGGAGVLQAAVDAATPGTTLLVSGTCSENVVVTEDKSGITLDGQSTATISGPDATQPTVRVKGRGITIKGFIITGGNQGIQISRGTALINSNTIQGTGAAPGPGIGISIQSNSSARIIFNTIENNPSDGIQVNENSSARIGILAGSDTTASLNTIRGNGGRGIRVTRSSNARIVGNTIENNAREGIRIQRDSQADISSNSINGNASGGITVESNSGVNLGNDTGTGIFDLPNTTTVNNTNGFGIRCFINSYADGRLGSLNGTSGATSFSADCINSLNP